MSKAKNPKEGGPANKKAKTGAGTITLAPMGNNNSNNNSNNSLGGRFAGGLKALSELESRGLIDVDQTALINERLGSGDRAMQLAIERCQMGDNSDLLTLIARRQIRTDSIDLIENLNLSFLSSQQQMRSRSHSLDIDYLTECSDALGGGGGGYYDNDMGRMHMQRERGGSQSSTSSAQNFFNQLEGLAGGRNSFHLGVHDVGTSDFSQIFNLGTDFIHMNNSHENGHGGGGGGGMNRDSIGSSNSFGKMTRPRLNSVDSIGLIGDDHLDLHFADMTDYYKDNNNSNNSSKPYDGTFYGIDGNGSDLRKDVGMGAKGGGGGSRAKDSNKGGAGSSKVKAKEEGKASGAGAGAAGAAGGVGGVGGGAGQVSGTGAQKKPTKKSGAAGAAGEVKPEAMAGGMVSGSGNNSSNNNNSNNNNNNNNSTSSSASSAGAGGSMGYNSMYHHPGLMGMGNGSMDYLSAQPQPSRGPGMAQQGYNDGSMKHAGGMVMHMGDYILPGAMMMDPSGMSSGASAAGGVGGAGGPNGGMMMGSRAGGAGAAGGLVGPLVVGMRVVADVHRHSDNPGKSYFTSVILFLLCYLLVFMRHFHSIYMRLATLLIVY